MDANAVRAALGALGSEAPDLREEWCDYAALGLANAPLDALLEVALEEGDDAAGEEFPLYRAVHAWRALLALHGMGALREFLQRARERPDLSQDEWLAADIGAAIAMRADNVDAAGAMARNEAIPEDFRQNICLGIGELARRFPEARAGAAAALCEVLRHRDGLDSVMVSFAASALADTGEATALPILRELFAEGAVDLSVLDWHDILRCIPDAGPDPTPPELLEMNIRRGGLLGSPFIPATEILDAVRDVGMPDAGFTSAAIGARWRPGHDPGTFREKQRSKNKRKPKKKRKKK